MTEQTLLLIVAAVTAIQIPIAPKMLRLRVFVLRKVHLNWLANFHEKNSRGLVVAMRSIMVMIIVVLLWIALSGA